MQTIYGIDGKPKVRDDGRQTSLNHPNQKNKKGGEHKHQLAIMISKG